MPIANTETRYGIVTKCFHWSIALMIFTVIPLGILADRAPYATADQLDTKALLFSLHKTLGLAIFLTALARILWALTQQKPKLLNGEKSLEALAAEAAHWLLYGSLVLVPLTGWITHAASEGLAPIWWPFGQSLPFVPKSAELAERFAALHMVFERVMVITLLAHILGALKHHVVDRDATLRRMWFGTTEATGSEPRFPRLLPPLVAVGVWAAGLAVGAGLGVFAHDDAPEAAALQQVASDWQVQDGTLDIVVTQFGSEVGGQFADWTAAIQFDETAPEGPAGSVQVTIATGSLTLGSVTDQALGPDFFDAGVFPRAVFDAQIVRTATAYEAQGTVTIKDTSVPVTLPFDLTLQDGTATVAGELVLDRRAFGIGDSMTDEGQLKFDVAVKVALTAQRAQ